MTRGTLIAWLGFAIALAAAVGVVVEARRRTLVALDTPEANAQWQVWREDTIRQSRDTGPATRRPAKAFEPPLLIMLRDHFGAAIGSTVVAVTIFYWFLAFLIPGSLQQSAAPSEPHTPRGEK